MVTFTENSNCPLKSFIQKSVGGLKNVRRKSRCVVVGENGVVRKFSLISVLPTSIIKIINIWGWCKNYFEENQRMIDMVKKHLDVDRIGKRLNVNMDNYKYKGITKRDLQKIFLALADIRIDDTEAAFKELKEEQGAYLKWLDEKSYNELKEHFKDKEKLSDICGDDMRILVAALKPFDKISDITIDEIKYNRKHKSVGRGFGGLRNNLLLIDSVAEILDKDPLLWKSTICKEYGKVSGGIKKGMIIPHSGGFYQVDKVISGEGAFKVFLKCINKEDSEKGFLDTILYRGSAFIPWAPEAFGSIKDDLRTNIGSKGYVATKDATKKYLLENKEDKRQINLIGYSLGGGHLQRDLVDFLEDTELSERIEVCNVDILSGVGVDKSTVERFDNKINNEWPESLKLAYNFSLYDVVPFMGECSLGGTQIENNSDKISVCIHDKKESFELEKSIDSDAFKFNGKVDAWKKVAKSFKGHHQDTWCESYRENLNSEDAKKYLQRADDLQMWNDFRSLQKTRERVKKINCKVSTIFRRSVKHNDVVAENNFVAVPV